MPNIEHAGFIYPADFVARLAELFPREEHPWFRARLDDHRIGDVGEYLRTRQTAGVIQREDLFEIINDVIEGENSLDELVALREQLVRDIDRAEQTTKLYQEWDKLTGWRIGYTRRMGD